MAEERQPPNVVEGATTGDVEEDVPATAAKSAEDRKAAAALAALDDTPRGDEEVKNVDQEAARKAMNKLGGGAKQGEAKKDLKRVKVDAGDVTLLVDQLELTKTKATELLKQHDGDVVKAMRAFIAPRF
ncbi:uncharacterized protein E0L32_003350 [Thyridium curvatum]|uniref:Nascent polypeptide-associated complex subunit alpha-like UBA domain-containing protein n=1 Tax=Thyridium curvatum TaxID=1093900 RepID=A0A507B4P2_9PEZI|nr:uncharacterized protein E0L32_003350 [Thyridium curvatum]TPX17232.1 hypothetical protein E0L32_003350 [Thyridium curvatum]